MKPKSNFHPIIQLRFVLITSVLLLFGLTSCDPLKHVINSNQTKHHVTILIEQDTSNILALGNESILQYEFSATGDSSQVGWIYGFGNFSKEDLSTFKSMIKQITISRNGEKCVISGTDLEDLLPQRRRGLLNNYLKIKIKNCPQQGV